MSNPLFNMFSQKTPGPFGNIQEVRRQFEAFKNSFRGDPQAEVQKLLNSGRVTQEQYNRAVQMAQEFQQILGK